MSALRSLISNCLVKLDIKIINTLLSGSLSLIAHSLVGETTHQLELNTMMSIIVNDQIAVKIEEAS